MIKMSIEYVEVKYKEFGNLMEELVSRIKDSGQKFSHVYGIPRGGLAIAIHLVHHLDARLILESDDFHVLSRNKEHNILIADDVCDSGKTLYGVSALNNFTTCTLHVKPRRKFTPSFYLFEVPDNYWIRYPWESQVNGINKSYMFK